MLPMLFAILLLEGFITISVEILTIRQLMPFFGGSVLITSIIIGVFLLFLALGYWRGGTYRQNFFQQLSHNFTLSMLWIGIGLSYTFIATLYYVTAYPLQLPFLLNLSLYLLLILAPVVYWLGQTIPLTTNLFSQQQRVSYISSRALFLSTMGSFSGALLTSLLLFQYLGVAWTVVINCFLLLLLIVSIQSYHQFRLLHTLLLFIAFAFILILNVNAENLSFKKTNNYANYRVIETNTFSKLLQINQSSSSLLTADHQAYPYIEYIRNLLFKQLALKDKKILMIGAGGFTLTADETYGNDVTYVDVDPDIRQIAETHFLEHPIHGQFIGQDARRFLQQSRESFDVIISDVYSHQATIPPALLSMEYFQAIEQHLNPNGLLIANIIANPLFRDEYSMIVHHTIHAVFPYCAVVPLGLEQPLVNMMYVCPKKKAKKTIYRDDLNTATTDYFKSRQKFRT